MPQWTQSQLSSPSARRHQRTGTRRRYQDDGISDDEIEGKRTFDLEEKLRSDRFNSNLVKHMEGKGQRAGEPRERTVFLAVFLLRPQSPRGPPGTPINRASNACIGFQLCDLKRSDLSVCVCVCVCVTLGSFCGVLADFTFEYIQREGLRDPLIFEKSDGLGIE